MPISTHSSESGDRFVRRLLFLTALALGSLARPAHAEDPSPTEADALFRNGLAEMRTGQYEVACPMLARSYQLDPLPGALFTEADCEAAWGKVATAIEHYQAFLNALTALPADRRAKFDERRRLALEKIGALGPLASELTIDVSLAPPASLIIRRNGVAIDRAAYGVSKRVDPGEFAIVAEIDGKIAWERHVMLAPGGKARVDVPWLETPKPRPATTPLAPSRVAPEAAPPAAPRASTTRTLAFFAGGIGLGGLAAGVVTGLLALHDKSVVDDNCPMRRCNAVGRDALESARASATVSTVGFSVGLAGVAGATILWLASDHPKKSDEANVTIRPLVFAGERGATMGVGGEFR